MGRYDMLALHVFLLNYHLKSTSSNDSNDSIELSQSVFDVFLTDLERGLRELGFADASVYKRKKRLARSYYALIEEFDPPLTDLDAKTLALAVANRYFDKLNKKQAAVAGSKLADYMLSVVSSLSQQPLKAIMSGKLDWPQLAGEKS
ncbi:MAG: hypothetical protein L3J32_10610 [Rhizobiaceae bacterium]|nr:hypothetical protein [Rhizobiaceae bacterium]